MMRITLHISAALLIAACTSPPRGENAQGGDKSFDAIAARAEINDIIGKYAHAVNSDTIDAELAAQVWATDPGVSFIHPRGHEHGWDQIKTNFYEKTMGEPSPSVN